MQLTEPHLVVTACLSPRLPSCDIFAGLRVSWTDEDEALWEDRLKASGAKTALNVLKQNGLPSRLAEALLAEASSVTKTSLAEKRVATLTKSERAAVLQKLLGYTLSCTGHEGYPKVDTVMKS